MSTAPASASEAMEMARAGLGYLAETLREHADGGHEIRRQQEVDDEAGSVLRLDGMLAETLCELGGRRDGLVAGVEGAHDPTSFITGTGEKKCRPTTRSGLLTIPPSWAIGMDEVFDARMVSGLTIWSRTS